MLPHHPVRHEQANASTALFGSEMRLEQMMSVLIGDPWPIVGDGDEGPTISPASSDHINTALRRSRIDAVIDQVGDHLTEEERIRPDFDILCGFASPELDLLCTRPWPRHSERPVHELVEVNWFGGVANAWRCSLG